MKIGYIGLGKMGYNMVLRLHEKGHEVLAYNRSPEPRERIEKEIGIKTLGQFFELKKLPSPRVVWVMLPERALDVALAEISLVLERGDTLIDGGNSFYKNTIRRASELKKKGIHFIDAGVSGGPRGAREGACVMVGGDKEKFKELQKLFVDISLPGGYRFLGGHGAGHFVKMVHNGIEYGMMQAIAEGFSVLRTADLRGLDPSSKAKFTTGHGADKCGKKTRQGFDLKEIAELYNKGSVVESRLVGWLQNAYEKYGVDLEGVSGTVAYTGEGEWTVETAKEVGVPVPIISGAFQFRVASAKNPSYLGQVLSALRNQFGGHGVLKQDIK